MALTQSGQEGTAVDLGVVQRTMTGLAGDAGDRGGRDDLSGMEVLVELAAEVQPAVATAGLRLRPERTETRSWRCQWRSRGV